MWDDRDLRPGVKFADAELIGYPVRVTVGKTFFESGKLEIQLRKTGEKVETTPAEMVKTIRNLTRSLKRKHPPKKR
ncbi:MAG TPA: His/Gly/Thr/Pro-type tRNA ligase C-terminal domain-containing protein [Leptospiraceae bacterium]|nr:His/Gly/Thr/Pro-type tRNA ligase C-terminal domain-containing protein [Leptospiraceae bacterium]